MNKTTKTLTTIATLSVASLFLVGCASSTPTATPAPAPAPYEAPAAEPAPYDPPVASSEDIYYAVIETRFPSVDQSTAVTLGRSVCSALDTGASIIEVAQVAVRSGFSYGDAGFIVGAAISSFCPQYESDARDLINN
jgi:hypothetical protein